MSCWSVDESVLVTSGNGQTQTENSIWKDEAEYLSTDLKVRRVHAENTAQNKHLKSLKVQEVFGLFVLGLRYICLLNNDLLCLVFCLFLQNSLTWDFMII